MDDSEQRKDYTKLLVDRALKGEHIKFELIRSFWELRASYKCRRAIKAVAKGFAKTGKNIFNSYLNDIKNEEEKLEAIFSYKQIKTCQEFYEKDAEILSDMISEYNCYLRWGHITKSILLNEYRPEEDLTDWRKVPIKW